MNSFEKFSRELVDFLFENYLVLGDGESLSPKEENSPLVKKDDFINLKVFGHQEKRYLIKFSPGKQETRIIDLDNARSVKKVNLVKKSDLKKSKLSWRDIRLSKANKEFIFSFTKADQKGKTKTELLRSKDLKKWRKGKSPDEVNGATIFCDSLSDPSKTLVFDGKKNIRTGEIDKKTKSSTEIEIVMPIRENFFDEKSISPAEVFQRKEGYLVFYYAKDRNNFLSVGAVLLDKKNSKKVLWRSEIPLWKEHTAGQFQPLGIVLFKNHYFFFGKDKNEIFYGTELPSLIYSKVKKNDFVWQLQPRLERSIQNPILSPREENHWEADATFNPAAVYLDGRVHLIYRAMSRDGISSFGYAASEDGINFDERAESPIYFPRKKFEFEKKGLKNQKPFAYESGSGWGGCEDPRIVAIDDKVFMTYIAFNGYAPPGVALTSISKENFIKKIWNWEEPKLISPAGEIQKNWVIFPEKLNGKYAILHSISPSVTIDYFDSLEDIFTIKSHHNNRSDDRRWDNILRGVGAPPIKTDYGWLVLYHAMDKRDPNRYKVGAMLLDLNDPRKIIHRCHQPILEPDAHYENNGFKSGVVYVCGSIIKDGRIFVYYGGADKFVCAASAPVEEFLSSLIQTPKIIHFKRVLLT